MGSSIFFLSFVSVHQKLRQSSVIQYDSMDFLFDSVIKLGRVVYEKTNVTVESY